MSGSIIKPPTIKQIIAGLLAILMMFSTMIKEGKFGKVEFVLLTENVTTESEEIVLEVRNYTLKYVDYNDDFLLEKLNGETWEKVPVPGGFYDYAGSLRGLTITKDTINFEHYFNKKLDAGDYRLTKEIGRKDYVVSFTVVEASSVSESTTQPA